MKGSEKSGKFTDSNNYFCFSDFGTRCNRMSE